MIRFMMVFSTGLLIAGGLVGCGGSTAPTNVAEDADAAAIADYEAMVASESAAMEPEDSQ